jgi:hypothetical protein
MIGAMMVCIGFQWYPLRALGRSGQKKAPRIARGRIATQG